MRGLHNAQRAPAQKTWPGCTYCAGTGLTTRKFQKGFFSYEAGVTCPECSAKHQDELRHKFGPEIVVTANPYVGMKNLEFAEQSNASALVIGLIRQARLEALEEAAKIADKISNKYAVGYYGQEVDTADEIAAAIRERAKA